MTANAKVHHGLPPESLSRLKPHKLGRHYHKIPLYIRELSNKQPRIISDYFLRNYRINLALTKVQVHEQHNQGTDCIYRSPLGKVGFAIDRSLLTEVLECYYGGVTIPGQQTPPISTSEERMRARLGIEVTQLFARAMLGGDSFGELEICNDDYEETQWEYIAELTYHSQLSGVQSSIFIYLDTGLVDELTNRLANPTANLTTSGSPINQIQNLPVRLNCVIASLQMPLAQVLGLRPGDIIPIRMRDRCDVEINAQKLYRGALFEDDGALFLTSLESLKTP